MRFAVVSDIHLGDSECCLVRVNNGKFVINDEMYKKFAEIVGRDNNYLILLGDILDFSISQYQDTFRAARVFFARIQEDKLAKEMIFVPGNHDADLWHTVEYQVNIINQIAKKAPKNPALDPVRPFRLSVPGIIDDRKDTPPENNFTLAGVTRKESDPRYAGLFLDDITDPATRFNFAYPNVYVVTDNETVLLTHGQYFEKYWAISGELAMELGRKDLDVGWSLSLKDMVGINFPLSQLACSGIGQAGPLTKVARTVQKDVKNKKLERVKEYFKGLEKIMDKWIDSDSRWKEFMSDRCIKGAKEEILKSLEEVGSTRFDKEFLDKTEVMKRFLNFYSATIMEINELNNDSFKKKSIKYPGHVIFGHTHLPIPWKSLRFSTKYQETPGFLPVYLHNTGGWLYREVGDKKEFDGAEIFIYDQGVFTSHRVTSNSV